MIKMTKQVTIGSLEFSQDVETGYFNASHFCIEHNCELDEWISEHETLIRWFESEYNCSITGDGNDVFLHLMFLPYLAVWCDPMYMADIYDHLPEDVDLMDITDTKKILYVVGNHEPNMYWIIQGCEKWVIEQIRTKWNHMRFVTLVTYTDVDPWLTFCRKHEGKFMSQFSNDCMCIKLIANDEQWFIQELE